jgi:hypothetical protein
MNSNENHQHDVDGLIQELSQKGNEPAPPEAQEKFHQIAQSAPPEQLSRGIQDAFNSDQTPPFAQMVAQLFGQADGRQKSGILGALLGGLGGAAQPVLAKAGVTGGAEQAEQMSTGQVQQIAEQAQQADPGIVGQMSKFYAENPVLVKSLGAMAMALVLGRMSPRRR